MAPDLSPSQTSTGTVSPDGPGAAAGGLGRTAGTPPLSRGVPAGTPAQGAPTQGPLCPGQATTSPPVVVASGVPATPEGTSTSPLPASPAVQAEDGADRVPGRRTRAAGDAAGQPLSGKAWRDRVRQVQSSQAHDRRAGRGRYRPKTTGEKFGPGKGVIMPPGGEKR